MITINNFKRLVHVPNSVEAQKKLKTEYAGHQVSIGAITRNGLLARHFLVVTERGDILDMHSNKPFDFSVLD